MKALRILSWLCLYKLHRLLQCCNIFLFQLKFYILAFGNFVPFFTSYCKEIEYVDLALLYAYVTAYDSKIH